MPLILCIGDSSDIELASAIDRREFSNSQDAVFDTLLEMFEIERHFDHRQRKLLELKAHSE